MAARILKKQENQDMKMPERQYMHIAVTELGYFYLTSVYPFHNFAVWMSKHRFEVFKSSHKNVKDDKTS